LLVTSGLIYWKSWPLLLGGFQRLLPSLSHATLGVFPRFEIAHFELRFLRLGVCFVFHGSCAVAICFPVQQFFMSELLASPPWASFFGFRSRIFTFGFVALAVAFVFMAALLVLVACLWV
jgi:hypothetical protein